MSWADHLQSHGRCHKSRRQLPLSSGGLCFIPNIFFRTQKFMFGLSPVPHRVKMFAGGSVWRQTLSGRWRQTTRPTRKRLRTRSEKVRQTVIDGTRIATCKPHPPPKYLILDSIPTFPFHPHRSCGGVFFFFLLHRLDRLCLDVGF